MSREKYLKVLSNSYFILNSIALISGLLNEILCIFVAQETAKLPNVKVGGLKKFVTWPNLHHALAARV